MIACMSIWFTADEHYGHENIIRHCNRPFADAAEMERELVRRHNALVGEIVDAVQRHRLKPG